MKRILGKAETKTDHARVYSDKDERRRAAIARKEEALLNQDLAFLRHQLEHKTQSLNNSKFEVTEEWLFEFASMHAEYMEKASSKHSSSREIRSTTDLLHHVLQHPSVIHMFEAWSKGDTKAEPTDLLKQPDLGDISFGSAVKAQRLLEEPPLVSKPLAKSSSSACIDNNTLLGDQGSLLTSCEFDQQRTCIDSCLAQDCHRLIQPASRKEQCKPFRRVSTPGMSCNSEEGELVQKLRQRVGRKSWQGLSPRSLRLAQAASSDGTDSVEDAVDSPEKLKARRRLLEDKLKACGFHTHAPTGGA